MIPNHVTGDNLYYATYFLKKATNDSWKVSDDDKSLIYEGVLNTPSETEAKKMAEQKMHAIGINTFEISISKTHAFGKLVVKCKITDERGIGEIVKESLKYQNQEIPKEAVENLKKKGEVANPQVVLVDEEGFLRPLATVAMTLCVKLGVYSKETLQAQEKPDFVFDSPLLAWSDEGLVIKIPKQLNGKMKEALGKLVQENPREINEKNFGRDYDSQITVPFNKVHSFVRDILTLENVATPQGKINIFNEMILVKGTFNSQQKGLLRGTGDNIQKLAAPVEPDIEQLVLSAEPTQKKVEVENPQVILFESGGLFRPLATVAMTLCVKLGVYSKKTLQQEEYPDHVLPSPLLSWSDEGLVIKIPAQIDAKMKEALGKLIQENPKTINEKKFGREYVSQITVPFNKVHSLVKDVLTLENIDTVEGEINIFNVMTNVYSETLNSQQKELLQGKGAGVQKLNVSVKSADSEPTEFTEEEKQQIQEKENQIREWRESTNAEKIKRRLDTVIPLTTTRGGGVSTSDYYYKPTVSKEATDISVGSYEASVCASMGYRDTMEDVHFAKELELEKGEDKVPVQLYGIFDGHGGKATAQYANEHFHEILLARLQKVQNLEDEKSLWNAFKLAMVEMNEACKKNVSAKDKSGSTALIAVIIKEKVYVLNLGDSRSVFSGDQTIQLSEDAKVKGRFRKTAEKRGGAFLGERILGTDGKNIQTLMVARSLGDKMFKGITARPKIIRRSLEELGSGHLILASDGLWDVVSSDQVSGLIGNCKTSKEVTEALHKAAFDRRSADNVTVMSIDLRGKKRNKASDFPSRW